MAGHFEIFTDVESNVRFRLLGADGTVLAVSKAFADKPSAAEGIMAVRECAGTGLIQETHATPWGGTTWTRSSRTTKPRRSRRHLPAV